MVDVLLCRHPLHCCTRTLVLQVIQTVSIHPPDVIIIVLHSKPYEILYTFELSHVASLLASMLPIAAITRQMNVSPPMMYNHWLLLINVVQE